MTEVQNAAQLFRTGLRAHPFYMNAKFLPGAASHYQQLLFAICESCKLKQFFLSRNNGQKSCAECLIFLFAVEVNQPSEINDTGAHGLLLPATAWHNTKRKYRAERKLEAEKSALHSNCSYSPC
jgi:hypothetical protein